jgi:hypothetical protein
MGRVHFTRVDVIPEGEPILMGVFSVANQKTVILFNSGASHTFINRAFAMKYQLPIEVMDNSFSIQSPSGRMITQEVIYQIPIVFARHIFPTNLIVLKGKDIDVILGMNWLCQHGAVIDTLNRTIQLNSLDNKSKLILHLPTPKRTIERSYRTTVKDVKDIPIVREFPDVFPDDLLGLPLIEL